MRRSGEYQKAGKGGSVKVNLNEDLLLPALNAVTVSWRELFRFNGKKSVVQAAQDFVAQWSDSIVNISTLLGDGMKNLGLPSTELVKVCHTAASASVDKLARKVRD